MYIVAVLNLFAHLGHRHCSFLLKMLKVFATATVEVEREMNESESYYIDKIPMGIPTVLKALNLEPTLTIFAICPSCCALYQPTKDPKSGVLIYPSRCGNRRFENSQPCNARLTKNKVVNNESVREPIRPFAYQSLQDFEARFLNRPEIEEILNKRKRVDILKEMKEVWDIGDAPGVREIIGADKKPFLDGPEDELRLLWR
jgi:hypothetical protein